MKCQQIHNNLIFYSEGSLDCETKKKIDAHLSECLACSTLVSQIKNTLEVIDYEKSIEVSPFIYSRIEQKLKKELIGEKKYSNLVVLKPVIQYVLIAAMVLVGLFFGNIISSTLTNNYEKELLTEEYFFNDIEQETIEYMLIND